MQLQQWQCWWECIRQCGRLGVVKETGRSDQETFILQPECPPATHHPITDHLDKSNISILQSAPYLTWLSRGGSVVRIWPLPLAIKWTCSDACMTHTCLGIFTICQVSWPCHPFCASPPCHHRTPWWKWCQVWFSNSLFCIPFLSYFFTV